MPFTVGLALSPLAAAVLAHLVLAFPDGRLHSGLERFLVVAAYVNAIAVQIVMLMFMGIEHVGGCPCPRNLLFVRDDMSVHSALMNAHRLGGIAIAAGVATVLVRRWQSASPLLRRALAPILVTGGATAALLAAMLIADQASAGITTEPPVGRAGGARHRAARLPRSACSRRASRGSGSASSWSSWATARSRAGSETRSPAP